MAVHKMKIFEALGTMKKLVFASIALALSACNTMSYWHRTTDGLRVDADPALFTQFRIDGQICQGEQAKTALTMTIRPSYSAGVALGEIYKGCMAQKGYALIQDGQAPIMTSPPKYLASPATVAKNKPLY
jgi:hypothetical protein